MCRLTRTNSNLQNSTLLEEGGEATTNKVSSTTSADSDSVTSQSSSVEMPCHPSLRTTWDLTVRMSASCVASAAILTQIHSQAYVEDEISSQECLLSQTLPSTSAGMFIMSTVLLLPVLVLLWRERIRSIFGNFSWTKSSDFTLSTSAGKKYGSALSGLSRVTSVDAFKIFSKNFLHSLDSCSLRAAMQAITRKECFARSDYIERLSINDLAILYHYASNMKAVGFDKTKFLSEQTQIVCSVITAMDMAVKVSRGCLKQPRRSEENERTEGDIDALYFVAVTRVFAEWRTLRLVPKGYQRYAVGLSLGYRDVLQNLEKIERGVHDYLRHHQEQQVHYDIQSPSLQQLIRYEIDQNLHKKLPKLEEKSSASGILWTKRQLHYQVLILSNSLEVPKSYPSAKHAASAAYRIVYDDYHGWAVKQIFSHSFGGSPPLDAVWTNLDPPKDMPETAKFKRKQAKKAGRFQEFPGRTLSDVSDDSKGKKESDDNEFLLALDNMNRAIVEKWEDALRMFNCGTEEKKKRDNLVLSSDSHFNLKALDQVSAKATKQESLVTDKESESDSNPIERSKRSVEDFVRAMSPLIQGLGEMIQTLNMNDPTRV